MHATRVGWLVVLPMTVALGAAAAPADPPGMMPPELGDASLPPSAVVPADSFQAGRVDRGTAVVHGFVIRNEGEGPLRLFDAKPDCGCTVAQFDRLIPPGGQGVVQATMKTDNLRGQVTKIVAVTTNDPASKTILLQLGANVVVPMVYEPSQIVGFSGRIGELKPQEVTFWSEDGAVFDVRRAQADDDENFTVEVYAAPESGAAVAPTPGVVASGSNRYLMRIIPGANVPAGPIDGLVRIRTSHPRAPEDGIMLVGEVAGRIVLDQEFALIERSPEGETVPVMLSVWRDDGEPFELNGVESDDPRIAASYASVDDGRRYEVGVHFMGSPTTTAVRGLLSIHTNDQLEPLVEVPVLVRPYVVPAAE